MRDFLAQHGYPISLLDTVFLKASQIPRSETLRNAVPNVTDNNKIPLVLAFHPFNFKVRDLITKNFHILKNDPKTSAIFSNNSLVSFRDSKNTRDTLVHSNLPQESSSLCRAFQCGVGQCKICKFIDSSTTISAPKPTFSTRNISREPPPISFTAYHAVDVTSFISEKLADL